VLEEPPKHALWCESAEQPGCENKPQQLVVVSRFPTIAVGLVNKEGTSFSGERTDNTDWTIGGSAAVTAKGSVGTTVSVASTKISLEGTLKVS